MTEIIDLIREQARELFREKKVSLLIGYRKSSLPTKMSPIFIKHEEDIEKLIWNELCNLNPVNFIPKDNLDKLDGKIALILRTCEIKSFIVLINEKQLNRENFIIIAVPCQIGKINSYSLDTSLDGRDILEFSLDNEKILVKGDNISKELLTKDYLLDSCSSCQEKFPTYFDILIDIPENTKNNVAPSEDLFLDVEEFEKLNAQERWSYLSKELEKCNRCYACRNACPLCYCKICFVDSNQPQWFSKLNNLSETHLYHLTRAIHLAGRCIECGACVSACPEGVNVHVIYKKIQQTIKERWDYKAGEKIGDKSPLGTYNPGDPQEFIVEED